MRTSRAPSIGEIRLQNRVDRWVTLGECLSVGVWSALWRALSERVSRSGVVPVCVECHRVSLAQTE